MTRARGCVSGREKSAPGLDGLRSLPPESMPPHRGLECAPPPITTTAPPVSGRAHTEDLLRAKFPLGLERQELIKPCQIFWILKLPKAPMTA